MSDSDFSAEDFRSTATAFSQAAGVLGGFSITVFVLALPDDFMPESPGAKDWAIGLILLAAFLYIYASLILANSMNSMMFKNTIVKRRIFSRGIVLLHSANISLSIALVILVWRFSSKIGLIAVIFIVIIVVRVALFNFRLAFGFFRRR